MTSKGNDIVIPQLTEPLWALSDATTSLDIAKHRLSVGMQPYLAAQQKIERRIADLYSELDQSRSACIEDPNIAQWQDAVDKAQMICDGVKDAAIVPAIAAWKAGETHDKKRWQQDGYSISLRTTRTPVVTNSGVFLAHIDLIGASAIVEDVVVKLNRKAALALHEAVALAGLTVTSTTKCTLKKLE